MIRKRNPRSSKYHIPEDLCCVEWIHCYSEIGRLSKVLVFSWKHAFTKNDDVGKRYLEPKQTRADCNRQKRVVQPTME